MSRVARYMGLALTEASKSTHRRVRIGAVVTLKGRVVGKGANLSSSHPLQKIYNEEAKREAPEHNLHAELHALINSGGVALKGAHVYVARYNKQGTWAHSKPCPACTAALKRYEVKSVTFSHPDGWSTQYVRDL